MIRTRWEPGVIYDQGKSETCVGFAWAAALRSVWGADETDTPQDLYKIGYKRQYGDSYGLGSQGLYPNVIGDALKEAGYIKGYQHLAVQLPVYLDALSREVHQELQNGPLLLSTVWYAGFDIHQGTHMEATGENYGRHCTAVLDCCHLRGLVIQNSHGAAWGNEGRKFLGWRLLAALLSSHQSHLTRILW